MQITHIDHLVLTARDQKQTCNFYSAFLDMKIRQTDNNRKALHFGTSKINLHKQGAEFSPHALAPTPGSADLCLITEIPIDVIMARLKQHHLTVVEGPVQRTGARGPLLSVYFRDPDGNLLEVANTLPLPATNKRT